MSKKRVAVCAGAASFLFAASAIGQQAIVPKPGYQVPPENSAGLYPVNGEPVFKAKCAGCHEPAVEHAPSKQDLSAHSPEQIYDNLMNGSMKTVAADMSQADIYGVVRYLAGKSPVPNLVQGSDPNLCASNGPLQPNGPVWNGWGVDMANSRYQPRPGLAVSDIPKLKVKWAFSYIGTKNTQPLIFGDRVYAGSMSGKLYSLDAKTGCVHWRYDYRGGARASMTIGKLASAPSGYALYLGDDRMYLRAFDARSGKELWTTHVYEHKVGRITGSPTLYNNVLYVPLSASEESQGNVGAYGCCTFNGTVVAVNAASGKILWTQSIIDQKPQPTRKNAAGTQMYGPAGGAIWSAPTVDALRGQIYVTTGDSYTEVEHPATDAVLAMDMKTGKVRWTTQVFKDDNYMSGTINAPLGERGPDYDFGASSMLVKVGGKDLVITGNKSSNVYAMDPDTGKIVWQTPKLGVGGASGGVHWGTATDGKIIFAALGSEVGPLGKPGMVGLDPATGKELWRFNAPRTDNCSVPSGRCEPGFSGAASAMPGAVFAGALDGHLRAFAAADGRLLWDYDAAAPLDTVNGVKQAPGGSMDMGGPTIGGGMLFVHSGYQGSAGASNLLLAFSLDGK
jgi:polyvinyl alcohol dehydrogenase (cytochrome)